jgi:hypothetical protein
MSDNIDVNQFYLSFLGELIIPGDEGENSPISYFEKLKINLFYDISNDDLKYIYEHQNVMDVIRNLWTDHQKMNTMIERVVMYLVVNPENIQEFIQNLPENIKSMINELLHDTCAICLDDKNEIFFQPCGHGACASCSPQINKCHMCRRPINGRCTYDDILKIKDKSEKDESVEKSFLKKKELKIVYDIDEFVRERSAILFSKGSGYLSNMEAKELFMLVKYFYEIVKEVFCQSIIDNVSIVCFTVAMFYKLHNDTTFYSKLLSPNRLLRFLNAYDYDTENDDGKSYGDDKEKINLKNKSFMKKIILSIINYFPQNFNTETEFLQKEILWRKLIFHHIHPFEKKNRRKYPKCFGFANNLINYDKIDKPLSYAQVVKDKKDKKVKLINPDNIHQMNTLNGLINSKVQNKDISVFQVLLEHPGIAYRMFRYLINQFKDFPELMIFKKELCKLLTIEQKIQLYEIMYRKTSNIILTKNKTLYYNEEIDEDLHEINEDM